MAAMCLVRGFVALAIVALVSYVTSQEIEGGSDRSFSFNDRCNHDNDCRMDNAYCLQSQGRCACQEGFKMNGNSCVRVMGLSCRSETDCADLPNSRCINGLCNCRFEYVPHPEEPRCLERKKLGEHCNVAEQCHTRFNFNSHCVNEVCVCRENHHESRNRTCIQSKALQESCVLDEECYLGDEYKDRTVCIQNSCTCKREFITTEDGKCRSGAPGTQVWSSLIALAVMASGAKIITM